MGIIGHLLNGTDNTACKEVQADREAFDQRLREQQLYTKTKCITLIKSL
jgi:hypothetical protein